MGGKKRGPCWNYVIESNDGKWVCTFCKQKYSGAAARIVAHISGTPGISKCPLASQEAIAILTADKTARTDADALREGWEDIDEGWEDIDAEEDGDTE